MVKVRLIEYGSTKSCILNLETGNFSNEVRLNLKDITGEYTGVYFKNDATLLALFPSKEGPRIFFKGKIFPLDKALTINWGKLDEKRYFSIKEYGIDIVYDALEYGWDNWSYEEDVDLLLRISQQYKNEDFVKINTKETILCD